MKKFVTLLILACSSVLLAEEPLRIWTDFKGKTIAVNICDSGLKYLSTDLWDDEISAST